MDLILKMDTVPGTQTELAKGCRTNNNLFNALGGSSAIFQVVVLLIHLCIRYNPHSILPTHSFETKLVWGYGMKVMQPTIKTRYLSMMLGHIYTCIPKEITFRMNWPDQRRACISLAQNLSIAL